MNGMFLIIEAVTQLRGAAGAFQQPNCNVALCHGNGVTLSSQVTTLLGTAVALKGNMMSDDLLAAGHWRLVKTRRVGRA